MQQWIRCPRCGTQNAAGQRFCNACGTPLASACPSCGTPVNPGTTFCPRCGMTLGGGVSPQQPGYPSQQPGGYYPPQQPGGYYPPQQPGYPPQQPGYPPQQPGYPPQQPGYPPQQPGGYYPPQQPGYPPQQPGYPPQQPGYPPTPGAPGGYYPPQQPGYPPQQPGYPPPPPSQMPPRGGYPASQGGGGKGALIFLLIILLAGLGGFGYWAYSQGYLKSIPFLKFGSDNTTTTGSQGVKDPVAPKINNLKVDTPALDGFWVRFDTDKPANCYVEYGIKGGALTNKTEAEMDKDGKAIYPITSHAISVKNLTKSTDYQIRVVAKNLDGVSATSETRDVKTASD